LQKGYTYNTLDVSINPEGSGTVSLSPSGGTYPEGTEVTLTPSANSTKKFLKWGGTDGSSVVNNKIVMTKNMAITADFEMLFSDGLWHGHYANLSPITSDILLNLSDNKITKVGSTLMSSDGSLCSMIAYVYFANVTIESYFFSDIPVKNGSFNYSGSDISITGTFTSANSCTGIVAYNRNSNRAQYNYVATSLVDPPTLTTTSIRGVTRTTATSGGNITDDGGSAVTVRGVCWSTALNPTIANNKTTNGTGTGAYTSSITGLATNTTYYVRAYATNSAGTGYGNEVTFASEAINIPSLTTTIVSNIATSNASCGGNISDDGGLAVTSRGVCWSTSANPTITDYKTIDGSGMGVFTSSITGLITNTPYYVRAYATNNIGTAYGNQLSFTTNPANITDIDGNVYNVIRIGTQLWMKENLKTTKYSDGSAIPLVTDYTAWRGLSTPGYCWYK
jgi:hypothetical protein